MAKEFYELGDFLTGSYPRYNLEGMRTRKRIQRTFQLTEIRDLNVCPLEAQTLAATPTLCRSDILLTGIDCDSGEVRSFYLNSFEGLRKIEPGEIQGKPPRVALFQDGKLKKVNELPDIRDAYCKSMNDGPDKILAVPIG